MIILKEQEEEQSLKFIPRQYKATSIVLVNEMTNESTTISSDFYIDGYYLYTTATFDLKEGTFVSVPQRLQIPENIKEQLIVELYNK